MAHHHRHKRKQELSNIHRSTVFIVNLVSLCMLAVVYALGLPFVSGDDARMTSRHVLDAVASGPALRFSQDYAVTAQLQASCERCEARKLLHGGRVASSGDVGRYQAFAGCTCWLCQQERVDFAGNAVEPGAAATKAVGLRGGWRSSGRGTDAVGGTKSLRFERETRSTTAFVHSVLTPDSGLDSRSKGNRRMEQNSATRSVPGAKLTADDRHGQTERCSPVTASRSRAGGVVVCSSTQQDFAGWGAAKSRRTRGSVAQRVSPKRENKNSQHGSFSSGSAAQQQTDASSLKDGPLISKSSLLGEKEHGGEASNACEALPPLLITIGPPCSGKTTVLRRLDAKGRELAESGEGQGSASAAEVMTLADVAIDDHPSVYYKIPVSRLCKEEGVTAGVEDDPVIRGRPLSERLAEPGCQETRLLALRLRGKVSAEEFTQSCGETGVKASPAALGALCSALNTAVAEGLEIFTPTVDIFVRESLFPGAVSTSQRRLENAAQRERGLVAWGNTNTQARDFSGALEQAARTGRPVRFIRWGHELPFLSLEELSRRNIYRFASTGRYVETAAIESALGRIKRLYARTGGGDPVQLALVAGFHMDASGRVTALPSPPSRQPLRKRNASAAGDGETTYRGTMGRPGHGGVKCDRRRANEDMGEDFEGISGGLGNRKARITAVTMGSGRSAGRTEDGGMAGNIRAGSPSWGSFAGHERVAFGPLLSRTRPQALTASTIIDGVGRDDNRQGSRQACGDAQPAQLRLMQEWRFRENDDPWSRSRGVGSMGSASRLLAATDKPPTVVFGHEWGRKRDWRRESYSETDLDPYMESCYFQAPVNGTRELKRNDGDEPSADYEEMDLIRRVKSFREVR